MERPGLMKSSMCLLLIMAMLLSSCATTGTAGSTRNSQGKPGTDSQGREKDSNPNGGKADGNTGSDSGWSLIADILTGVVGGAAYWFLYPYTGVFLEPVLTALNKPRQQSVPRTQPQPQPPPPPPPPPHREPAWAHTQANENVPDNVHKNYPGKPYPPKAGKTGMPGRINSHASYPGPYRPGWTPADEEKTIAFWESEKVSSGEEYIKKEEKVDSAQQNSFWAP